MNSLPPTRQSLVARLVQGDDRAAWNQFVDLYAPLVFQFARRRGLQDADAADIAQEVLWRVADAFHRRRYRPHLGTFRGWLLTITRHEIADWCEARGRREQAGGGTDAQRKLNELSARDDDDAWQRDYDERLLAWAAEQVRGEVQPATWQAFWETSVAGRSGQEVATQLGLTVAAVYLAKSRVIKRLRELVAEVEAEAPTGAAAPTLPGKEMP